MSEIAPTARRSSTIASLDGLRALAVALVIAYHLDWSWAGGGFIGVDVFYVISGFVITRLLLDLLESHGRIPFVDFYRNRIRRLMPALVAMVLLVAVATSIWAQDSVESYLQAVPPAISGTTNIWLLTQATDYFAGIGRPSLLQHTWSLGIEAQFYLVWPLIVAGVHRTIGARRVPRVALILGAGSLIAYIYAVYSLLHSPDSVSHLYFGLDTHSLGLLLGSALAVNWVPRNLTGSVSDGARNFVDAVGAVGASTLLLLTLIVTMPGSPAFDVAVPVASVASTLLVAALVHPAARISRLFEFPLMQWIGTRSYGIYLWHWPVFELTRPGIDIAYMGWAVDLLRIGITLALAEISYQWLELPIRQGRLGAWISATWQQGGWRRTVKLGGAAYAAAASILVAAAATSTAMDLQAASQAAAQSAVAAADIAAASREAAGLANSNQPATSAVSASSETSDSAQPSASPTPPDRVWVIGDSVMLGAQAGVRAVVDVARYDAKVGRQMTKYCAIASAEAGSYSKFAVVLNVGNNGYVRESELRCIFDALANAPRVVAVNASVPRRWQDQNNGLLLHVAADYPNVRVVDWRSQAVQHREYLVADGVHLTRSGVAAYAAAIAAALDEA